MSKFKLGLICGALVLVLGSGVFLFQKSQDGQQAASSPSKMMHSTKPAPSFELKDAKGQTHRLEDFRGKWTVLHFWATWCPPCLDEVGDWLDAAEEFEDKPIRWLAVSLDKTWAEAHQILPDNRVKGNIVSVIDPENRVPEKFGSYQYPETYLLSPDLKIAAKWVGPQDWKGEEMKQLLESVLKMSSNQSS